MKRQISFLTPVELTSPIYFFNDARILASTAQLFGKEEDFVRYDALARKIQNAVNSKYLDTETGKYGNGTQTAQSVALMWGIVPAKQLSLRKRMGDTIWDPASIPSSALSKKGRY